MISKGTHIDVFHMARERQKFDHFKTKAYTIIYEKIKYLINDVNTKYQQTHLIFKIPKTMINVPSYNDLECLAYCEKNFRLEGLQTRNIVSSNDPIILIISWNDLQYAIETKSTLPFSNSNKSSTLKLFRGTSLKKEILKSKFI